MNDAVSPDPDLLPPVPCGGVPDPIGLLSQCLARITDANDVINAVVILDRERAERASAESADRWRRGNALSPIDGVPILVKANIAVAGMPWHAGIAAYRDRISAIDAPVVARLRAAGAVILGLTNMDEGALGATGDNSWLGRIGNPHRPTESVGGSSGGSAAAVAAGFCMAALGSDTIGSIAIPAAYCGIVGHRASRSLMPIDSIFPLSPSFDHGGFLTHSVGGAMALGKVLGCRSTPAGPFRIAGWATDTPNRELATDAVIESGIARARSAGWPVDRVELPVALSEIGRRLFEVAEAEGAVVHNQMLHDRPTGFSSQFRRMLEWGASKGAGRRAAHLAELAIAAEAVRSVLNGYDALLMPATPHAGFAAGSPPPTDQSLFAALPACLGWPATTIPANNASGLALLVTAPSDDMCFAIARRLSNF